MIPKKIHYCWFGGKELPKLAKKCIASWKKYCPEYEIIEWNESNFDIDTNPYTRMCYDTKKYAFLTDYIRLVVVERYGGIYFDTDVELLKSPEELLNNNGYIGFETKEYINTGMGFGSVAHGQMVRAMLAEYDVLLDGMHGVIGCPQMNTHALTKLGMLRNGEMQTTVDYTVYPIDWFNPYDVSTGWLKKTRNSISVHWYAGGGVSKAAYIRSKLARPLHRLQKRIGVRK
ncbi:MAG: glycosyltransferase [Eubacteriales bacterium]|nr:glycosyltransferase [Eubacteriales bacterium]